MITLPKKEVVREYELTYLAAPSLTESEQQKLLEEISTLVTKSKGTVVSSESWGKKALAYTMKANKIEYREAVFMHLVISLPSEVVSKVNRDVQLHPQIIRHLLVKADDQE